MWWPVGHKEVGVEMHQNVCSGFFLIRYDDVLGYFFFYLLFEEENDQIHVSHGHLMIFTPKKLHL